MARVRASDYDDKRKALLDVAAQLFARSGFDRSSMSEIAAEAGVSKALVYHYYASKSELLFDILFGHLNFLMAEVEAADKARLADKDEPRAHLRKLIGALLFAYRNADTMHKIQINDLDKLEPERQKKLRALERRIVEIFSAAIVRLNPTLGESASARLLKPTTMSLFGILNWSYLWFDENGPVSRAEFADLVTRLFVEGASKAQDSGDQDGGGADVLPLSGRALRLRQNRA